MTYAITMMKGKPTYREDTLKLLVELGKGNDFKKKTGTSIDKVFVSFGWPDFILLLRSDNVELIKDAIIKLRKDIEVKTEDTVETSTIICSEVDEINRKKKEFFEKLEI